MKIKNAVWELEKEFRFEASHILPKHDQKCSRMHGHSWKGSIILRGSELNTTGPKSGMLVDFSEIKRAVDPLIELYLDHHHLNETTSLANPTSEELARWIYLQLKSKLSIYCIKIEETCTSACRYYPNGI